MATFFLVQSDGSKGRTQITGNVATAFLYEFAGSYQGLVPSAIGAAAGAYLDKDGAWSVPAGGAGVSDGDKGDIVVSSSGTVWSIDYTAVNATIAPVWGNITSMPAAVTALSGTNTGDQNLFSTIAVSGQSDVVADAVGDTLTLAAGANITITTDAGTDTITIAASGGGGASPILSWMI